MNEIQLSFPEASKPVPPTARDLSLVLRKLEQELELYPEVCEDLYYLRPVGSSGGKIVFARGFSIRAAEMLDSYYPNSAYRVLIVEDTDKHIKLEVQWIDQEMNKAHSKQIRVSKWAKNKVGELYKRTEDRLDVIISANISKTLREMILRSVPLSLRAFLNNKAEEILRNRVLSAEKTKIILDKFNKLGVTRKQLEKVLDKNIERLDWKDRITLLALYNSLRDGYVNKNTIQNVHIEDKTPKKKSMAISSMSTMPKTPSIDIPIPNKRKRGRPPKDKEPNIPPQKEEEKIDMEKAEDTTKIMDEDNWIEA